MLAYKHLKEKAEGETYGNESWNKKHFLLQVLIKNVFFFINEGIIIPGTW